MRKTSMRTIAHLKTNPIDADCLLHDYIIDASLLYDPITYEHYITLKILGDTPRSYLAAIPKTEPKHITVDDILTAIDTIYQFSSEEERGIMNIIAEQLLLRITYV